MLLTGIVVLRAHLYSGVAMLCPNRVVARSTQLKTLNDEENFGT
jgi:hypothetical protein